MIDALCTTKTLLGISDGVNDDLLGVYLQIAERKILEVARPYDASAELPEEYIFRQCEIAVYLWNKQGAEGQTSHTENGISRAYENADIPLSMLAGITPRCGVIRK